VPIYEYKCPKCKKIVELQQKMDERAPPVCCEDECNIEMYPVISAANISFKGSGWAKDGYSNKKD